MERLNDYISKKVISMQEGSLTGYVVNLIFDETLRIFEGLAVVDEESENTFFLPRKNIVASGKDCVLIDNSGVLQFYISTQTNNPVNKEVYDGFANFLGRVEEVFAEGRFVKKIATSKCEFLPRFVKVAGDNFIILGRRNKGEKRKVFKDKKDVLKDVGNLPLSYITSENLQENIGAEMPVKLFANESALIGKMVTNNILGLNNELIANKFDIIDKKIINKAKNHNKLNLLAYYSK